jgi:hypothetical protein
MLLVRDTPYDEMPATERMLLIKKWLEHSDTKGTTVIIPDVEGLYYVSGSTYNVESIKVPEMPTVTFKDIREKIKTGDNSWREIVAPGTDQNIMELLKAQNVSSG